MIGDTDCREAMQLSVGFPAVLRMASTTLWSVHQSLGSLHTKFLQSLVHSPKIIVRLFMHIFVFSDTFLYQFFLRQIPPSFVIVKALQKRSTLFKGTFVR